MTAQVGERTGGPAPKSAQRLALAWPQGRRRLAVEAAATLALYALWLLCRPFPGLDHDSRVYIGRAMADLDPQGIGRDLMFAQSGQASFSLYTLLARETVRGVGPVQAAALLGFAGVSLWFAAMWVLVRRLAEPRLAYAMLAFVVALPSTYGGLGVFQYGEVIAAPRALAEAGVLGALAALADHRRLLAMALLAVAALFHPIMAAGGVGVVLLVLAWEDRRWLNLIWLGGAAILAGAAVRAPVLGLLFERADAAWLVPLHARNPYLFLGDWSAASWGAAAVQIATVLVAAALTQGRARAVLIGAVGVACLGVAAAGLLGDGLADVLILQLQPWRALWLTAALAAAGLGLCAVKLASAGARGRIVLALLVLGWLGIDLPYVSLPAALAALALQAGALPALDPSPRARGLVWAAWTLVVLFAAGWCAWRLSRFLPILAHKPAALKIGFTPYRNLGLHTLPIALAAWAAARAAAGPAKRLAPAALALVAAALACAASAAWGEVLARAVKGGGGPSRTLTELLAARPGDLLWVGGDTEAWRLAGRAAWVNDVQGASIVFSRPQALVWQDRAQRLIKLGLARHGLLDPWNGKLEAVLHPTTEALSQLCRSADAPVWVVTPVPDGDAPPELPGTVLWRGPFAQYRIELRNTRYTWRRIQTYAVAPCRASS